MALRINIRHLKRFAWVAVLLAMGGAVLTFVDVLRGKYSGDYEKRPFTDFQAIRDSRLADARDLNSTSTTYSVDFQATMWEARTDGSVKPLPAEMTEPAKGPAVPVEKVLEQLDTVIDISMVAYNSTPGRSFVALRYADAAAQSSANAKARRLHLGVGDPLRSPYDAEPYNGKVLSIESQKVVFSWGGEDVALTPQLGTDGKGGTLGDFDILERADPLDELGDAHPVESVQLSDGSWVIGETHRKQFRERGAGILDEIGVRTVTPASGRSSIELIDVPEDHIIKTYGFSGGDRIISVNGIPMASKSAAWNWYSSNDGLPTYTIKYESRGQVKTTVIQNPDAG